MSDRCPKCSARISPLYMKETCPKCNVNLLYYGFEDRLEQDARQAEREVAAVEHFVNILKSSSVSKPILIARLALFFTPLASMCLPMYDGVSLVSLIMGIIKGSGVVVMPLISMALVVVLSLAVIISSLFSSTKRGLARNVIFSAINTVVFVALGLVIGKMGVGWYITLVIYLVELVLHFVCDKAIKKQIKENRE